MDGTCSSSLRVLEEGVPLLDTSGTAVGGPTEDAAKGEGNSETLVDSFLNSSR